VQDVTVVGTSMGAAVIWSYVELFGVERLGKAVFVDQAPLQVCEIKKDQGGWRARALARTYTHAHYSYSRTEGERGERVREREREERERERERE
jgi:pimeloyl-ACP methyl ester carboxylesterase